MNGEIRELNLTAYLDIVINVMLALLVSVAYMTDLHSEPVKVPALTSGATVGPVQLGVHIATGGYTVLADKVVIATLPNVDGALPERALLTMLRTARGNGNLEPDLLLTAAADVPYRTVVATLDAVRRDASGPLFPAVSLGVLAAQ